MTMSWSCWLCFCFGCDLSVPNVSGDPRIESERWTPIGSETGLDCDYESGPYRESPPAFVAAF
jgi:hypothetical protein